MTRLLAAAAALSLLAAGAAHAQATKTAPASAPGKAPHAAAKPTPSLAAGGNTAGHSAAAIDCSKQADAKGLHGKAREKFRSSCKSAAKKA